MKKKFGSKERYWKDRYQQLVSAIQELHEITEMEIDRPQGRVFEIPKHLYVSYDMDCTSSKKYAEEHYGAYDTYVFVESQDGETP